MKENSNEIRERIIHSTTELIKENNGEVKHITSRNIAARAQVALGLINYHFGSKEELITICVQRIISGVVQCFAPKKEELEGTLAETEQERLKNWACQVFNFLFANPAISRISILGDMHNYDAQSNSVYTQKGLLMAFQTDFIPIEDQKRMVFLLISAMQVSFLAREQTETILGVSLFEKAQRDQWIGNLVDTLFEGGRKK